MQKRRIPALLAGVMLVLAACSGAGTTDESGAPSGEAGESGAPTTPAGEQVLRVDLGVEPPTLDPNQAEDSASISVLRAITRPLAYFDESLEVVPELAESWDISPDGTQVTFHLRDGLTYSNGDPIVAGDFVYSWKRLIDPRTAAPYSYVMADVVGGEELLAVDTEETSEADIETMLEAFGVSAPDDATFVVDLARPASYFPFIAALWVTAPVPQAWIESEAATEAENYVSSGPFKLTVWEHNARIVLERNENWYGEPPLLERIDMAMIADPAASLAAYEADELDTQVPPSEEVPRLQDDPDLSQQIITGDALSIYYMGFDLKDPEAPTARSKALRYALSQSVDKEALVAIAFSGVGTAADSVVPPGMPGHQADIGLHYDLEAAQASMAAALDELGLSDPSEISLEIGYNTDSNHEAKVEFLQEQWRTNLGIDVQLVGLEWGAYLDRLDTDPFDVFRLGWGADYPHPNNFLTDLFTCTSGNNNMGYCNEDYDALLAEANALPTLDEQLPLYAEAQELLLEDAPMLPLRFGQAFYLAKPWVQGLAPTAQDSQNVGDQFYELVSIADH